MFKRLLFWFLYLIVSSVLALLILEGAVRLLNLAPPITDVLVHYQKDPFIPFKPKPYSEISGRSSSGEFDFKYKHNSFGFRDLEHAFEKPKGVFRILGLGDSFTYGVGASFENTYFFRLEKMLNERSGKHPKVEIIKGGIPSYYPEPERLLLQHYGVRYNPDLIIVGFLPNDVGDTYMGRDWLTVGTDSYLKTRFGESLGELGTWLYINSHAARIVLLKIAYLKTVRERIPQWPEIYRESGLHEGEWRKVEGEFERINEIARSIGAKLVVVHIPQKMSYMTDVADYPARRLSAWAEKCGVTFIDILPAMKEASENEFTYWEKDGHCTPAGYRVIAETIYRKLLGNGLMP